MRDKSRLFAALVFASCLLLAAGCAERKQAALDPFVGLLLEQQLKAETGRKTKPTREQAALDPFVALLLEQQLKAETGRKTKPTREQAPDVAHDASYNHVAHNDVGPNGAGALPATQVELGREQQGLAAGGPPADFDAEIEETALIADPLQPWNRFWFSFNDTLYMFLFRPLALGYNYVTPQPIRKGVSNFFFNWKFPIRFVNCLLQGKVLGAGVEFSRFVGNTLFGGLGVYNILEGRKAVVEPDDEDFGQTLGFWGVGPGPYIVWPILGPSTLRDTFGFVGDFALDPITYINPWFLPYSSPAWWSFTASGVSAHSSIAGNVDEIDALKESAVEQYTSFRNGYMQTREKKITK